MSSPTPERRVAPDDLPPPDDPYRYGWRDIWHMRPDGTTYRERIGLTLWDVLHPEIGDCIPGGTLHERNRTYIAGVLRARLAAVPGALVIAVTAVYWDKPELKHHCPDVCVIFNVKEDRVDWEHFCVREQGTRPSLIIELVSPLLRKNDVVTKVNEYHIAEVPCYVIVDREQVGGPWSLKGYTYDPAGYIPMATDARGRLWLAEVNLWLGVDGLRVLFYDGNTSEEIGDYTAITRQLEQMRARAEAEKARAMAEADNEI